MLRLTYLARLLYVSVYRAAEVVARTGPGVYQPRTEGAPTEEGTPLGMVPSRVWKETRIAMVHNAVMRSCEDLKLDRSVRLEFSWAFQQVWQSYANIDGISGLLLMSYLPALWFD
jgi:hypothetical protein